MDTRMIQLYYHCASDVFRHENNMLQLAERAVIWVNTIFMSDLRKYHSYTNTILGSIPVSFIKQHSNKLSISNYCWYALNQQTYELTSKKSY